MALYIPYRGRLIAVETENDPHPDAVCPGDCPACAGRRLSASAPARSAIMENVADAWMIRGRRDGGPDSGSHSPIGTIQ